MSGKGPFKQPAPARGTFLVASPRLLDPNFMHAVVLVIEHDADGTYGVIVNRPTGACVADLGSSSQLLADRKEHLWVGGPVAVQQLQLLHRFGDTIPGTLHLLGDIHLGGDEVALEVAARGRGNPSDSMKFVVGYSGWSSDQLQGELREGAWVVCPAEPRFVFDPEPGTVWRRVLASLGPPWSDLANVPPDPSWN